MPVFQSKTTKMFSSTELMNILFSKKPTFYGLYMFLNVCKNI